MLLIIVINYLLIRKLIMQISSRYIFPVTNDPTYVAIRKLIMSSNGSHCHNATTLENVSNIQWNIVLDENIHTLHILSARPIESKCKIVTL